jgi:hypothetical protein
MNAPPGQFKGLSDCFIYTAKLGPSGFFKGGFENMCWVKWLYTLFIKVLFLLG